MDTGNKPTKILYHIFFFVSIFLFYFFLAFNTPLTGDDWTWGTNRGIQRLKNYFDGYNGRYFSNILEILSTRYEFFRYMIHAGFSLLLVYTVGKFTNNKNNLIPFLLSFIFLLLVPTKIFSQTFGWTAGFVNYVPSIALLLLYLIIVKNIFEDEKPSYKTYLIYIVVPLGIMTQLIVEHVSLFSLFTALLVIGYTYLKHRKVYALHLAYFVSSIIGSGIMFSNRAYWNILLGDDSYRTISNDTSLIRRMYDVYSGDMYKFLFTENLFINLFIGLMVIILISSYVSKTKLISLVLKPFVLCTIIGYLLYVFILKDAINPEFLGSYLNDFEALFSAIYFLSIVLSILVFVTNSKDKTRLLYELSGIVLLSAPFLLITPYGPRAALASYVFFVLVGIELFVYNAKIRNWSTNLFIKPFLSTIIILVVFYISIFSTIGHVNNERLAYLSKKIEEKEEVVYLPKLPFSQYMWMSSPPRKHFNTMFKRFHHVDESVEVKFISYNKWKKIN